MRRRRFRPALDGLESRIALSDCDGMDDVAWADYGPCADDDPSAYPDEAGYGTPDDPCDPALDPPIEGPDDPFGPPTDPIEPDFPPFDGDDPGGVPLPPAPIGPAGPASAY